VTTYSDFVDTIDEPPSTLPINFALLKVLLDLLL
jgi:hypothetical protein